MCEREQRKWSEMHDLYLKCVNDLGALMQASYKPQLEVFQLRKVIAGLKAENKRLNEELHDIQEKPAGE